MDSRVAEMGVDGVMGLGLVKVARGCARVCTSCAWSLVVLSVFSRPLPYSTIRSACDCSYFFFIERQACVHCIWLRSGWLETGAGMTSRLGRDACLLDSRAGFIEMPCL